MEAEISGNKEERKNGKGRDDACRKERQVRGK